jgi:predicted DNA-binding protein YlxM (UPF0122 family)
MFLVRLLMNDLTRRALYFDFYGSLLTAKQQEIYDLYYQQDLSFGEISEIRGVSREAVFDLLRRTEDALNYYENKLKLVRKYQLSRNIIKEIRQKIDSLRNKAEKQKEKDLEQIVVLLQKLEDSW